MIFVSLNYELRLNNASTNMLHLYVSYVYAKLSFCVFACASEKCHTRSCYSNKRIKVLDFSMCISRKFQFNGEGCLGCKYKINSTSFENIEVFK